MEQLCCLQVERGYKPVWIFHFPSVPWAQNWLQAALGGKKPIARPPPPDLRPPIIVFPLVPPKLPERDKTSQ